MLDLEKVPGVDHFSNKAKNCNLNSHKVSTRNTRSVSTELFICSRALPDITSGPDVRQIFKIRTVRKPDIFLPGRLTFNTSKNRKKKNQIFF